MKSLIVVILVVLFSGCEPTPLKSVSPPNISTPTALASVNGFVATNGWKMYTNQGSIFWEDLDTNCIVTGLPWTEWKDRRFQALTRDGIFFALLDSGFHHDYSGIAYNPLTNRFPECIRGFKPIGGHWYVWFQPEFQSDTFTQKYE